MPNINSKSQYVKNQVGWCTNKELPLLELFQLHIIHELAGINWSDTFMN